MSSGSGVFFGALAALALPCGPVAAQAVYGPTLEAEPATRDAPVPLQEPEICEDEVREDGAIVVCRELTDPERYMSPLPRPVEVRINQLDGLREPPCWVTGKKPCLRMGSVPPYPPMIDTTAFPEPLSEKDAAAVFAAQTDSEPGAEAVTGERVPIDIGEND